MIKNNVVNSLLAFSLVALSFISACKETKEVKVEEHVNSVETPAPTEADKNVNVDVNVQQPGTTAQTKQTDVIIVDKNSKDIAALNANIQKLQDQVKSSNEKAKADLNKQIQQMNAEKAQLQKQVSDLKVKAQTDQSFDLTKQQYRDSVSSKLDSFTKKLDDAKTKAADLNELDKTQADTEIASIEDNKSKIETKLSDIDGSPDAAKLKLVRTQIDNMLTDLDKKYNQLVTTKLSAK